MSLFSKVTIFSAKTSGYSIYRIPVLICTAKGTLIAFTEARENSGGDYDHSALVARRCIDPINNFDVWEDQYIVKESKRLVEPINWAEVGSVPLYAQKFGLDIDSDDFEPKIEVCTHNAVPIVDKDGITIHLIYCDHYDCIYYTKSTDDGLTWTDSVVLTEIINKSKEKYEWMVIAAGPGHGLQIEDGPNDGRLVVPIWFALDWSHRPSEVGVAYSDDAGSTWQMGDFVPFSDNIRNPNETLAVQLSNGNILLNSRNEQSKVKKNPIRSRAFTISEDGAHNWTEYSYDKTLPEPICMGSIIRFTSETRQDKNRIIFTNPDCLQYEAGNVKNRKNLTAWLSTDDCKSWPIKRVIEPEISGYSDLAVDPTHKLVYCMYEDGGIENGYQTKQLAVVKFNLEWVINQ
jgi:sialidase-1